MAPHALQDLSDGLSYTHSIPKPKIYSILNNSERRSQELAISGSGDVSTHSVYTFSKAEIDEIVSAVKLYEASCAPLGFITEESFLLPTLHSKLREASSFVHNPRGGFMLLRGLEPEQFSPVQNIIIHAGLSSHVGGKRAMTARKQGYHRVLNHVTAIEVDQNSKNFHGLGNQRASIPFHSDPGHLLSLYTISRCESGGSLYLANTTDIYAQLDKLRPDVLMLLQEDWAVMGDDSDIAIETRPLLYVHGGHVIINCVWSRILGAPNRPRPASLPSITAAQREALDVLNTFSRKVATKIDQQPGDLLLVNNLGYLHARDAFVDNEVKGLRRHALHLMVKDDDLAWSLPEQFEDEWDYMYSHENGDEEFPIEAALFHFISGP